MSATAPQSPDARVLRLERALERERAVRREIETMLEDRTRELFLALEELRKQASAEHVERLATLGGIAAGIAHEINNALNFVRGNIQHLDRYIKAYEQVLGAYRVSVADEPEKARQLGAVEETARLSFIQRDLPKLLASVSTGVNRATTIVRDLGVFSRVDTVSEGALELGEPLEIAMTLATNRLKHRKVEQNPLPDGVLARGTAGRISQVLLNLLLNAADATGDNGEIVVGATAEDQRVVFYVRDSGPGIPEETRPRVFDPFFTTKEPGKGTGLGLFVSLQIAREHGGALWFESTLGQGTTFFLAIPRHRAEDGRT